MAKKGGVLGKASSKTSRGRHYHRLPLTPEVSQGAECLLPPIRMPLGKIRTILSAYLENLDISVYRVALLILHTVLFII